MKKLDKIVHFLEYRGMSTKNPLGTIKSKELEKAEFIVEDYNAVVDNINTIFGYKEEHIELADIIKYNEAVNKTPVTTTLIKEDNEFIEPVSNKEKLEQAKEILKVHPIFIGYIGFSAIKPMIVYLNNEQVLKVLNNEEWYQQSENLVCLFTEELLHMKSYSKSKDDVLHQMDMILRLQPVLKQVFPNKVLNKGSVNLIRAIQLLEIEFTEENTEMIKIIVDKTHAFKMDNFRVNMKEDYSIDEYIAMLSIGNKLGNKIINNVIKRKIKMEDINSFLIIKDTNELLVNEAKKLLDYETATKE